MIFVNTVASIVHSVVVESGGFPNKNIGDAFLCVWPLPVRKVDQSDAAYQNLVSCVADKAVAAYREINIQLKESLELRAILECVPGHDRVRIGSGLHVGWSIVGAIGSRMKLDASYLGPHTNLSARLEGATKQYGTNILLSDAMYRLLSPAVQQTTLKIDNAFLQGSSRPLGIYAANVRRGLLYFDPAGGPLQWVAAFTRGEQAYEEGDFQAAREALELSLRLNEGFHPSHVLLEFMKGLDWRTPREWMGARALQEK